MPPKVGRTASSFRREAPRFRVQPRVLVVCEDSKSSKNYFEEAARHFRSYALVEFSHCGNTDPLGIVKNALTRQRDFEHVYCALDRDSHQNWDEAMSMVTHSPKVKIVASYPCFEFWLLLHRRYTRAPYTAVGGVSAAERVLRELRAEAGMDTYIKGNVRDLFFALLPDLATAKVRAARTVAERDADDERNPSTEVHKLLEALEELSVPMPKN